MKPRLIFDFLWLILGFGLAVPAWSTPGLADTASGTLGYGWLAGLAAAALISVGFWWWRRIRDFTLSPTLPPGDELANIQPQPPSWIPRTIFLGATILIGMLGGAFYHYEWRQSRTLQEHQLATIADFKRQQIEAWLGERRRAAMTWRKGSIFGETVVQWLAGDASDHALERQVEKRLWTIKEFLGYAGVALLDHQGRIRLRVGDSYALSPRLAELSQLALGSGQVQFSDLYRATDSPHGDIDMDFIAPLSGLDSERPVATLVFTLAAQEFLFPLIQSWPLPDSSAEIVLVRREAGSVMFMNALRHRQDAAFNLSFPLGDEDLLAVRAVTDHTGLTTGRDYRGVEVLAFITGIEGTPWRLIAKIDATEVEAPARRDAVIVTGVCLALILAAGATTELGWRRRRHALEAAYLQERAKRAFLATRLDDLARDANDIILLTDTHGAIRDANQRALVAYGRDSLKGLSLLDLVPIERRPAAEAEWRRALQEGQARFETMQRSQLGGEFPAEITIRRIGQGEARLMQSIIRDISERRRAEAEIQRLSELNTVLSRCHPITLPQIRRDQFLEAVCRLVVRHGGFAMACAYGVGEAEPRLLAHFGNHPGAVPVAQTTDGIREVAGEMEQVRRAGSIWLPDARDQKFRLSWLGDTPVMGFGSYAALPLFENAGFMGILLLFSERPEVFARQVDEFLKTFAENTALSLEFIAQREDLQASRDRISTLLDTIDAVIWSLDPYTFALIYANPSIARITGYAAEVLLAHPDLWWNMVLAEDRNRLREDLNQAKLTGLLAGDYRIVRLDGQPRWINVQGRMVFDANHRPLRLDGVSLDITERYRYAIVNESMWLITGLFLPQRRVQEPYRQVAELLAQRLEFPLVAIDLYDAVTGRVEALGGSTDAEQVLLSTAITALVASSGKVWCETDMAEGGDPHHQQLYPLGVRSFIALPLRVGDETLGGLLLADREPRPDIDFWQPHLRLIATHLAMEMDRRRKSQILDRHTQELRDLLDSLFIYAGILTPEGMVIDINRTALDAAGLRLEEVQGKPFEETPWWSDSDASQQRLREALDQAARGEAVRYDTRILCRPGEWAMIDFGITPIHDTTGQVTHLVFSAVDISERCRADDALRLGFDMAPVGLAILDSHAQQLQKVNHALCHCLGYTEAALQGMTWSALLAEQDQPNHRQGIERLRQGSLAVYSAREQYRHRNGEWLPCWVEIRYGCYTDSHLDAFLITLTPPAMDGLS